MCSSYCTPKPEPIPIVKPVPISPPFTPTSTDTPTPTATAIATATNTPPPPATSTRIATASPSPTPEQLLGKDPEIAKIIQEKSFLAPDRIINQKIPVDPGSGNRTITHAILRGAKEGFYNFQFMLNGVLYDCKTTGTGLTFIVADERRDVKVLIPGTVVGTIVPNDEFTKLIEGKIGIINMKGGSVKDIRALDSSWFITIPVPATP